MESINAIRQTTSNRLVGTSRIIVGMMMLASGIMKFAVPMLWDAWSGQLIQAGLPMYQFNLYFVPAVEIVIGAALMIGFFARIGAVVVIGMMLVATYVHFVVDESVLPLQPKAPIIPLFLLALAVIVLIRGSGSWGLDLRSTAD